MTAPLTAEQVAVEIEQIRAMTPLPEGAAWRDVRLNPDGRYGPYAGGQIVEFQALCAWFVEAQATRAAGDVARREAARAVIRTIPTWRSFSATSLMDAAGQAMIREKVAAVLVEDFDEIRQFMVGNCSP